MAPPFEEKTTPDALTESLLNPDVEEQVVLNEELPETLHVGEKQPPQFRDVPFALLFCIQFIVVLSLAITWGFPALRSGPPQDDSSNVEFSGILYICMIAAAVGIAISALTLSIMTRFAQFLVQFSVLFSIFSSLLMVIMFGFQDRDGAAFVFFIFFAITCCWAWAIWDRIPFAASNLVTALTAVRANLGVALVAYGMVLAAVLWSLVWVTSLIGVYSRSADCDSQGVCQGSIGGGTMVLYLLSFYWTHQVFKNLIHVVVAGVVGTWWFDPAEASSLCSKAITDSLVRSVTFSFGSICFGSLISAAIQVCRHLVENARRQGNNGIVMCILDCLLGCLERIVEFFNKFTYCYVGLYGYSYLEAGRKVMSLFSQRGWSVIINDDLVNNVLSLMSLVVGGLTGCCGLAVAAAHKSWVAEFPEEQSLAVPFVSTFLIGVLIASILVCTCAMFVFCWISFVRQVYRTNVLSLVRFISLADERCFQCCGYSHCLLCRSS